MSKQTITEDDFKFVMSKHKDLILFFTTEEELKYTNNECGCYPDVPGVISINIWNDDLYGDTWLELKDGVVSVLVYEGSYNDYRPEHIFRDWKELDRWMSDGFIPGYADRVVSVGACHLRIHCNHLYHAQRCKAP